MTTKVIKQHTPRLTRTIIEAVSNGKTDLDFFRLNSKYWHECPAGSFDNEILEKADKIRTWYFRGSWSDLGNWNSIWKISEKTDNGNTLVGDSFVTESNNSLIWNEATSLKIITAGIDQLAVVATNDVVLVTKLDQSNKVKDIFQTLEKENAREVTTATCEYRPWGRFETLYYSKDGYLIKKIFVS